MPIRFVKPHSDRGSLKDVLQGESYEAPTPEELKLKQLYEHAEATRDPQLKEALGFIVMPCAGDRSAFPISIYRHREYVNSLSEKRAVQIEQMRQQLSILFETENKPNHLTRMAQLKQITARQAVLPDNGLIKTASRFTSKLKSSFKRAR